MLAEIDLVQIGLEDLIFRVPRVEHDGHRGLDRLAAQRALRSQIDVLDELLRERRAALHGAAAHGRQNRTERPLDRNSRMPVEVAVLRHENGVRQRLRDFFQTDQGPIFELFAEDRAEPLRLDDEGGKRVAVLVDDRAHDVPGEGDPRPVPAKLPPRIEEVAREKLDGVPRAPVVSRPFRGVRRLFVEEPFQLRDQAIRGSGAAGLEQGQIRVDPRGEIPVPAVEPRRDGRPDESHERCGEKDDRRASEKDLALVAHHPDGKRNVTRARRRRAHGGKSIPS